MTSFNFRIVSAQYLSKAGLEAKDFSISYFKSVLISETDLTLVRVTVTIRLASVQQLALTLPESYTEKFPGKVREEKLIF